MGDGRSDRNSGPRRTLSATQSIMVRGLAILVVLVGVGIAIGSHPDPATADSEAIPYTGTAATREMDRLQQSLNAKQGELELTRIELDRARALLEYSSHYKIPANLSALIYDTALREGLDPNLAFRLVKIESEFNPKAHSRAGAIGLTQVMRRTAAYYSTDAADSLEDPATNLRIGFQYLRDLLRRFDGDVRLALLAYNRGPGRVDELLAQGRDPRNGYASSVIAGYRRAGPTLP